MKPLPEALSVSAPMSSINANADSDLTVVIPGFATKAANGPAKLLFAHVKKFVSFLNFKKLIVNVLLFGSCRLWIAGRDGPWNR